MSRSSKTRADEGETDAYPMTIGRSTEDSIRRTIQTSIRAEMSAYTSRGPWNCQLGFLFGMSVGAVCTLALLRSLPTNETHLGAISAVGNLPIAPTAHAATATAVQATSSVQATATSVQATATPEQATATFVQSPTVRAPVDTSAVLVTTSGRIRSELVSSQLEADMAMVRRHAGLYKDKTSHPEFKSVVLVTASNFGYLDVLQNWECASARLGLDWVVLALDDETYRYTGSERSILVGGKQVAAAVLFGRPDFYVVACNKLRIVLEIMKQTGLDVVFSDCDNVFKSDPFVHQVSFGSMMRSGRYDYIYGRKTSPSGPIEAEIHKEPDKANTGFYFAAGSRKQPGIRSLFEAALDRCDSGCKHRVGGGDRPCDDQENFWDLLVDMRRGRSKDPRAFKCFQHCDSKQCKGIAHDRTFNYCDMDPFEFPEGSYAKAKTDQRVVAYHANWVFGKGAKIGKLKGAGLWGFWDSDAKQCRQSIH